MAVTLLELDLTGTSADNLRTNESHTLTRVGQKSQRAFVCNFGAFYVDGLDIRDANSKQLVRGQHYITTYHYEMLGDLTAKGVCGIIVVTDPSIVSPVRVTYQAVGGYFNIDINELEDVFSKIDSGDYKVAFEDIVNKPTQYPVGPHTHKYWQLYGLESTDENLDQLALAAVNGRQPVMDLNKDFYGTYLTQAQKAVDDYIKQVNAHLTDYANPHKDNATSVGLGNLSNWPMATLAQTTVTTLTNVYMPIGGIYNMLQPMAVTPLANHLSNISNPHQTKLTDTGLNLYSTAQIQSLFTTDRLAVGAIAYDSAQLTGKTATNMFDESRVNIDASMIDPNTKFTTEHFGPVPNWTALGHLPTDYALCGDMQFRLYADLLAGYNANLAAVYFVGSTAGNYRTEAGALAAIAQTASIYGLTTIPVGTYSIGAWSRVWNGTKRTMQLVVCRWNGSSWDRYL